MQYLWVISSVSVRTLVENPCQDPTIGSWKSFRILCRILDRIMQDPVGSYRILCRFLNNPVGPFEDFLLFWMHPKYITGSLKRESCKILIKGFNKEFLPGSLAEPSCALWHLTQDAGDPCCLTCWNLFRLLWLAAKWERDNLKHMPYTSTVITLNTYLQSLPSHHQRKGYIYTYMHVHDSETDNCGTVWVLNYSQDNHINGG